MGLIQELSAYLKTKEKEGFITSDEALMKENENLKSENLNLKNDVEKYRCQRDNALDEVSLCQKRIDSLLRQLSEKNGGK